VTACDRHQPGAVLLAHAKRLLVELDELAALLDTCRAGLRARIAALEHITATRKAHQRKVKE
jgi:hypothetical protein